MALIQAQNQLSDIIISHPDIIPVINRFGITLGTGDNTIDSICANHNLDTDFFFAS